MLVDNIEISVKGKFFRIARLRHEKFEFAKHPLELAKKFQCQGSIADVFTFVQESHEPNAFSGLLKKIEYSSYLPVTTHEAWWKALDFKVRNKIRKAQKSGVELKLTPLDDDFVKGVESIYNESPLRQGRKFIHYRKSPSVLKKELGEFPNITFFVGAYFQSELIGFMKLFEGGNVLRTVHIIAKLSHRDKPVMDALISRAVEMCEERKCSYLHYGSWTIGGLGDFRMKHGFQKYEMPRYFMPLTLSGKLMLKMKMHNELRERLPEKWAEPLLNFRKKALSLRDRIVKKLKTS